MFNLNIIITTLAFLFVFVSAQWPKRGLPYNNPPQHIQNWNGAGSQVNWAYDWDSYMHPDFPHYMEYVPMLWSDATEHTGGWFSNANNAISRGSGHLLSFNEPDACGLGQSCMSPQDAANAFRTYMMPYAKRASLGAPAVTNGPNGMSWLSQFLSLCHDCKIDFVPIHWYDSANNLQYFYNYVGNAHSVGGGRDIWLTEFHGSGTTDQQCTFLRTVMPWMDKQPWIYRYALFWADPGFGDGLLVDGNGFPTSLGKCYAYTGF